MCDTWHTVDPYELFVISQNNKHGQLVRGVCDTRHIVHSDELFVITQHNRNRQPVRGVCDTRHIVHSDELFVKPNRTETVRQIKVCAIYGMRFTRMNCLR